MPSRTCSDPQFEGQESRLATEIAEDTEKFDTEGLN
jgi:hypothetical protein